MTSYKILPVQYIARAIQGRSKDRKPSRVAILSAYLDASGSVDDPACRFITVAGYLATDEQWAEFEKDWQAALLEAGIYDFHMKDFAHSVRQFRAWRGDEKKRGTFLGRLVHIIKAHGLEDFGVTLNMEHYRQVNRLFRLREMFSAYVLAAGTVIGKIDKWHVTYRPDDSLLILLEKGDSEQDALRKLCSSPWWGGIEPIFIPKREEKNGALTYCLPFQASDFLAYELAKAAADFFGKGKSIARESLYRLRYGSTIIPADPPMWMYLDSKFLLTICAAAKIRRRK